MPKNPLPSKQRSLSPPYVGDRQQMYDRESFSHRHGSVTHLEPAVVWEDSDTTRARQLPSTVPNCAVSQSSQWLAQAFLTNLLIPTLTTSSNSLHRAMLYLKSSTPIGILQISASLLLCKKIKNKQQKKWGGGGNGQILPARSGTNTLSNS